MKSLIVACAVVICLAGLAVAFESRPDARMNALAKRYSRATTERERLTICIEAIDREVIRPGAPVADVDRIFYTNFSHSLPAGGEVTRGIVDFRSSAVTR